MAELITIAVQVQGKVQGVFYRATVKEWAEELRIHGWIRNEPDGSVRAVIQHAHRGVLDELLKRMWQGPPRSLVTELHNELQENHLQYAEFSIVN